MNAKDQKSKKNSTAHIRHALLQKQSCISTSKSNGACKPAEKPTFANIYLMKKKQQVANKENRHKENEIHPHQFSDRDRNRSKNQLHSNHKYNKKINNIESCHQLISKVVKKTIVRNILNVGKNNPKGKLNKNTNVKDKEKMKKQFQPRNSTKTHNQTELMISMDQSMNSSHLGCNENIISHTLKSGFSQSRHSQLDSKLNVVQKRSVYKTTEDEVIEFEGRVNEIAIESENQSLNLLSLKEDDYSRLKHYNNYLHTKQKNITWMARGVLLDWMMLLSSELSCKRQTYSNSVNILDRYLATAEIIQLDQLQCIGAVCLMIAQKIEDNTRIKPNGFHSSISEAHTFQEMLDLQIKIMVALKFRITAPTINSWANRLCSQWDLYLDTIDCSSCKIIEENLHQIKFKNSDKEAYMNYRWLMQYIDFCIMEIQTLQYKNRTLAASFLYLTLALKLNIFTVDRVSTRFRTEPNHILEKTPFNDFFSDFLESSFGFPLYDILPAIQYCSVFTILQLRFDLPSLVNEQQEEEKINFEEYCSIQTINQNNLTAFKRLNRNQW